MTQQSEDSNLRAGNLVTWPGFSTDDSDTFEVLSTASRGEPKAMIRSTKQGAMRVAPINQLALVPASV